MENWMLCILSKTHIMLTRFVIILSIFLISCHHNKSENLQHQLEQGSVITDKRTYDELKHDITEKRKEFYKAGMSAINITQVKDFWIKTVGMDLYNKWQGTPWDFNGTTEIPQKGYIACGYFVTTILDHMDCKISRTKLAVCPSLQMMKSLSAHQAITNLSYLDHTAVNNYFKKQGKGVYIIGLDFHTGIIVNDGTEIWFLHSNYIRRQGVVKETVLSSGALKSSKTKWVTSLTGNEYFLQKWLKGN